MDGGRPWGPQANAVADGELLGDVGDGLQRLRGDHNVLALGGAGPAQRAGNGGGRTWGWYYP